MPELTAGKPASAPHETDDVLDGFHGFGGDGLARAGAVGEHGIDWAGSCDQPLHLGGDRRELRDRQIGQRRS